MSEISKRVGVSIDPLGIKRIKSIDESGKEEIAEEPSLEEKFLLALGRIDFHHAVPNCSATKGCEEEEREREKKKKEAAKATSQPAWQWQGVLEHFDVVQQELQVISDLLTEVVANNSITLLNIPPRPLQNEKIRDFALRVCQKRKQMQATARNLKKTAQGLGKQVAKEGQFYGALMRLQQNWKIKRSSLRGIGPVLQSGGALVAAPSSTSGFSIDLSWAISPENKLLASIRPSPISSMMLAQDPAGKLAGSLGPNGKIRSLQLRLTGAREAWTAPGIEGKAEGGDSEKVQHRGDANNKSDGEDDKQRSETAGKGRGGVEIGAEGVHALLRRVQSAVYSEQFFEAMGREMLNPASGMTIVDMSDTVLEVSMGHGSTLRLSLEDPVLAERKTSWRESSGKAAFRTSDVDAGPRLKCTSSKASDLEGPSAMDIDGATSKKEDGKGMGELKAREMAPSVKQRSKAVAILFKQAFHRSIFSEPKGGQLPLLSPFASSLGSGSRGSDLTAGGGGMMGPGSSAMKGRTGAVETSGQGVVPGTGLGGSNVTRPTGVEGRGLNAPSVSFLKLASGIVTHQVYSAKVLASLEKQVRANRHLCLCHHPTWHPQVSVWELSLRLSKEWLQSKDDWLATAGRSPMARGRTNSKKWQGDPSITGFNRSTKGQSDKCSLGQSVWRLSVDGLEENTEVSTAFKCIIVVRDERIHIEGIHGTMGGTLTDSCFSEGVHLRGPMVLSIPEMESFIINQVLAHMSREPTIPF